MQRHLPCSQLALTPALNSFGRISCMSLSKSGQSYSRMHTAGVRQAGLRAL